jgi:sugar/nucleoside kinase (ribokinase family)
MAEYDVYGVGNALVDMEFEVSDALLTELSVDKGLMTLIDEERHFALLDILPEGQGKRSSGGSAANTIIATAQLGCNSFYSCKVANDDTGTFYMTDLANCGVSSNLSMNNREDGVTGKCIVLITPDAERSMNSYLGITSKIGVNELDESAIQNAKIAYIEGYLVPEPNAREAAIKAREIAQAANVKTALTLSDINMVKFFKDGLMDIVGDGLDMVFCNVDEAKEMFEVDSMSQCVENMKGLSKQFAITCGADGATLFDGQNVIDVAATKVDPIDTNGAGDMYAGAFLYGMTQGMPFEQCGELASAAAGKLITQFGARLPTSEMATIKKQFNI